MNKCQKCGLEYPEGFPECPDCGWKPPQKAREVGPIRKISIAISTAIVVLAALFVVINFLTSKQPVIVASQPIKTESKFVKDIPSSVVKPSDIGAAQSGNVSDVMFMYASRIVVNIFNINAEIINTSKHKYRNAKITCVSKSPNGTVLDTLNKTIFSDILPGSPVHVEDLNMGFINEQTRKIECAIVGVEKF